MGWILWSVFAGGVYLFLVLLALGMCKAAGDADRQTEKWLAEMRHRQGS